MVLLGVTALVGSVASALAGMPITRVQLISNDPNKQLHGIACPLPTQCTAIDFYGQAVTFNPFAPGTPPVVEIEQFGDFMVDISCPTTTQCTTVDVVGGEMTFNPLSPAPLISAALIEPGGDFSGVSCPSTTQCTAAGYRGQDVTFNPLSPQGATPFVIDTPSSQVGKIACPSVTQCTEVDSPLTGQGGNLITFDPDAPSHRSTITVRNAGFDDIACPTTTDCTAVDSGGGQEVTFDPTSTSTVIPTKTGGTGFSAVSCPTTTQCTGIGVGIAETFTPGIAGTANQMVIFHGGYQGGGNTPAIACPTASECIAVGDDDDEATFTPGAPLAPPPPQADLALVFARSSLTATSRSPAQITITITGATSHAQVAQRVVRPGQRWSLRLPAGSYKACAVQAAAAPYGAARTCQTAIWQSDSIRLLEGNPIFISQPAFTFNVGCHVDPECHVSATLSVAGEVVARARALIRVDTVGSLHLVLPEAVFGRLTAAGGHGLPTVINVKARGASPQSKRFELRRS